ncbi:MAG: Rrf2 family transcriptional regulator [Lachnospiraceae bacterium]
MKISTRGRYALRLMIDLAMNQEGDPVRIKDVATRQDISAKYLEQIVSVLVKARYVRSIRGPQGGYHLTRKPEEYCVGDIIRLIEGDMSPVSCLEDPENHCPRQSGCVTLRLWKELDDAIRGVLDRYTLADLVSWQEELSQNYVI